MEAELKGDGLSLAYAAPPRPGGVIVFGDVDMYGRLVELKGDGLSLA